MGRLTTRSLGNTGLVVSRLGLAALSIRAKAAPSRGLVASDVERAFHEYGVTTFLVHSLMPEVVEGVRRLIAAGHRERLVLVTESGLPFRWAMDRALAKLRRSLGTDHLDVYLVGWVRRRWDLRAGLWRWLEGLKARGEVRALGFSSHDRPLAAALAKELPVDVLMIRYNAAHRGAEREVFAPLLELGDARPGIIAYTATRWGMLLAPQAGLAPMSGPECYRFALGHPAVDFAWCAARSLDELSADVDGVLAGPLEPGRADEVRRFGDAVHANAKRGFKWMFGATSG